MKIGLIGSVESSFCALKKMIEHQMDIVAVWGYEPKSVKNVSGYINFSEYCNKHNLNYYAFDRINDSSTKQQIIDLELDMLFVVGLSQLIDKEVIDSPKYGCVGFHPTCLPQGRGRAPLAWLVLTENQGAATFFKIEEGADTGPIYIQELFDINDDDDAGTVGTKIEIAESLALDKWLVQLKQGIINPIPQDEAKASYYARRAPLDGCIDWSQSAQQIDRLVKASTVPHPGAFSFIGNNKIIIWKSRFIESGFPKGVIGRIVETNKINPIIQTGIGHLELLDYEMYDYQEIQVNVLLKIGQRLGYYNQYEIYKLRNEIDKIKSMLKI